VKVGDLVTVKHVDHKNTGIIVHIAKNIVADSHQYSYQYYVKFCGRPMGPFPLQARQLEVISS